MIFTLFLKKHQKRRTRKEIRKKKKLMAVACIHENERYLLKKNKGKYEFYSVKSEKKATMRDSLKGFSIKRLDVAISVRPFFKEVMIGDKSLCLHRCMLQGSFKESETTRWVHIKDLRAKSVFNKENQTIFQALTQRFHHKINIQSP